MLKTYNYSKKNKNETNIKMLYTCDIYIQTYNCFYLFKKDLK